MRHNPLCFTGHGRGSTLAINCLASFLVLWRASSASPRRWRAKRVLESITNSTARYASANLIEARREALAGFPGAATATLKELNEEIVNSAETPVYIADKPPDLNQVK
jgi:hypothetical protein